MIRVISIAFKHFRFAVVSQAFLGAETRYLGPERECLTVLRALEEVGPSNEIPGSCLHWRNGSNFPDHAKGRIAGWQVRIAEYKVEIIPADLECQIRYGSLVLTFSGQQCLS